MWWKSHRATTSVKQIHVNESLWQPTIPCSNISRLFLFGWGLLESGCVGGGSDLIKFRSIHLSRHRFIEWMNHGGSALSETFLGKSWFRKSVLCQRMLINITTSKTLNFKLSSHSSTKYIFVFWHQANLSHIGPALQNKEELFLKLSSFNFLLCPNWSPSNFLTFGKCSLAPLCYLRQELL